MKKIILSIISFILIQNICLAKDTVQFDFPNAGWHQVASPDGTESKKCFVPQEQSSDNFIEMIIFNERIVKTAGISPIAILQKQLGKNRNNYPDITPRYIKQEMDDSMLTWCSAQRNVCSIERAFQGNEGIILVTYINKMPHYSQNIFTNWINIIGSVKLYTQNDSTNSVNLIKL